MSGSVTRIYRLGEMEVDPLLGRLTRGGEEHYLRPKALQVLLYLIEQRQRLVTKEELLSRVWNGTAVTDDALVQCIVDIRKALGDSPQRPRFIKTSPRLGYRFIGPVEDLSPGDAALVEVEETTSVEIEFEEKITHHASPDDLVRKASAPPAPTGRLNWRKVLAAASVAVLLVASALSFYLSRRADQHLAEVTLPRVPGKKPLAVMYFENRSGDRELDWLREGLADMLITDLAHSPRLTVLSRQQLSVLLERRGYRPGQNIRLEQALEMAHKSRAEALVLGSFARLGEKVRADVQLHDARTGQLLAAEQLVVDRPEQILTGVDLLSLKLASHLGAAPPESAAKPGLARVMTSSLDAYRYYSLALGQVQMFQFDEAIALLEKAVALDPQFALAYARIGYVYAVKWGRGEEAKPYLEKAFQLADRLSDKDRLYVMAWSASISHEPENAIQTYRQLLAQDPLEVEAYERLGWLLLSQEKPEEALLILKQGTIIDPERGDLYNALGDAHLQAGNQAEAQAAFERYVALAPHDPNAYDSLANFHQWFGRYEQAIEIYQRALELNPESGVAILHLGHTYFQQGRYRAALGQYRRYLQVAKTDFARARGYSLIASLSLQQGEFDRAAAAAQRVVEYHKQPAPFPTEPLIIALAQGDRAAAEKLKPPFLAALPAYYAEDKERGFLRSYYYALGYLALREGKAAEAVAHFTEALRHRALIWDINPLEDCLANADLELGRLDEAIAEYERVLRLNPNYPLAHYHLGQAYERKGEQARARAAYERFLQVWQGADPDLPEVVAAKAKLTGQ